jgi:hypothetical protein
MIGIVLLSLDDYYLSADGKLPARPLFDKDLLLALCKNANIGCSPNVAKDLPKSIRDVASTINSTTWAPNVNLGISTFRTAPPDIMLVVRGHSWLNEGKLFDYTWLLDNYRCVSGNESKVNVVSVWLRTPKQLELDV